MSHLWFTRWEKRVEEELWLEWENVRLHAEDGIATITIHHPPANALNQATISSLNAALDAIEQDATIRVVLLTGEGKFFVAGADIKEIATVETASEGKELALHGQRVFRRMETFKKPIIAVINGACLGGGLELAMAAHIRYAAHEAKLGLPELNLGLIPGFAGTQRLPRLVGKARALEMILTSNPITGQEAEAIGLVNRSFPLSELMNAAFSLAKVIASKGGVAVAKAVEAVNASGYMDVEEGGAFEAELFGQTFETYDKKEGIAAFLEKRPPKFENR